MRAWVSPFLADPGVGAGVLILEGFPPLAGAREDEGDPQAGVCTQGWSLLASAETLLTVAGWDGPGRTVISDPRFKRWIHQWMEATESWMLPVQRDPRFVWLGCPRLGSDLGGGRPNNILCKTWRSVLS